MAIGRLSLLSMVYDRQDHQGQWITTRRTSKVNDLQQQQRAHLGKVGLLVSEVVIRVIVNVLSLRSRLAFAAARATDFRRLILRLLPARTIDLAPLTPCSAAFLSCSPSLGPNVILYAARTNRCMSAYLRGMKLQNAPVSSRGHARGLTVGHAIWRFNHGLPLPSSKLTRQ